MAVQINLTQKTKPSENLPSNQIARLELVVSNNSKSLIKFKSIAADPLADVNLQDLQIDLNEAIAESRKSEVGYAQMLADGIDKELEDVEADEEQKALIKSALHFYVQSRLDNHLQDVIPDEFFANLNEMLQAKEIEMEEILGVTMYVYEVAMGLPLIDYVRKLARETLPEIKKIFLQGRELYKTLLNLPSQFKSELFALIASEKFEEADELYQDYLLKTSEAA